MYHVRASNIPCAGEGAFAARNIDAGEFIDDYRHGSLRLSAGEFAARYPSGRATHVWTADGRVYYDAQHARCGKLNRAPRGGRNNARILKSGRIIATRRINCGDEILVAYGRGYNV